MLGEGETGYQDPRCQKYKARLNIDESRRGTETPIRPLYAPVADPLWNFIWMLQTSVVANKWHPIEIDYVHRPQWNMKPTLAMWPRHKR